MRPTQIPQLKPFNSSVLNKVPTNSNFLNTYQQSKSDTNFHQTYTKKKITKMEGWYTMTDDERNLNLESLKNKLVLNKNIYLTGFGSITQFENPPIFSEARNVFLIYNYKHFLYHWLTPKIFPNNPTIYLQGHPCDKEVLERGFKMKILSEDYQTAMKYSPNNPNISEITKDEFEKILEDYEEEEMFTIKY